MASFNKITIVGYLGRDPEIKYTPSGTAVCNLSVATTEKRKDQDGEAQNVTTWFRCTAFGRLAEVANQYLSKGGQVYLEGRLRQEEYTDRDGNKRQSLEVTVNEIQFLSSKSDSSERSPAMDVQAPAKAKAKAQTSGDPFDEDIPFN
jgi:single-strand DNA-binding protein